MAKTYRLFKVDGNHMKALISVKISVYFPRKIPVYFPSIEVRVVVLISYCTYICLVAKKYIFVSFFYYFIILNHQQPQAIIYLPNKVYRST